MATIAEGALGRAFISGNGRDRPERRAGEERSAVA